MKKIIQFINNHKLIFGLVLMILILIIFSITKKEEKYVPPTEIVKIFEGGIGPSQEEAEELTREQEQATENYPLWEKMPAEGMGYKISHYSAPLTVVVYIDSIQNTENVKQKVEKWISDNGGNVNEHIIEWRGRE